ncbi:TRAP transporter large permease [Minwuia thermotolerans]|uniref:TRAP transporter large permease protein n=1 Tax=Minwuia thermotolerans TaxID=2056226 RepID=A0A2M9FVB2_9PROT|nr:TRAP transporter large permease [Minwuia thermotolerans]PJK27386.1 C4-dicarboxylate ABC transporter permease [Minwuia thermotolerans]
MTEPLLAGAAILAILLLLIFLSVPIAFSLVGASLIGLLLFADLSVLMAMPNIAWSATNVFVLTAAPLFILMSEVIVFTGIGKDLFDAIQKWFGRLPGGLAVTTVVACAIFGAVSGTGVGVAAVVGGVAIPEMLRRRGVYNEKLATGTVASSSALGMVIPPSLPLIIYGVVTETAIADLFIAGIVPGLLITILFSLWIVSSSWMRMRREPEVAALQDEIPRASWRERILALRQMLPVILLVVLVIGSIYAGIATPTEAAGVGAVGAFVLAAFYRRLTWANAWSAIRNATKTTVMLMFIVIGAMLFGYVLSMLQVPQSVSQWVLDMEMSRWWVFLAIMLAFLLLGMFLDVGSVILVSVPVIFPTVLALGFDPVWFGIVMMVNLCLAVVTPPVGLCIYVVKNVVPHVSVSTIVRGSAPFLLLYLAVIAILCAYPEMLRMLY